MASGEEHAVALHDHIDGALVPHQVLLRVRLHVPDAHEVGFVLIADAGDEPVVLNHERIDGKADQELARLAKVALRPAPYADRPVRRAREELLPLERARE